MKILFIGVYSSPINKPNVPLNDDLCRALLRAGHNVTFLGLGNGISEADRRIKNKKVVGFSKENNLFKKLYNYLAVLYYSIINILFFAYDTVFIYSTPPFLVYPVGILAKMRGMSLIYDIEDLYPEILNVSFGVKKSNVFYRFFERIENSALRRCSLIRVLSPSMKSAIENRVTNSAEISERIKVIPNWIYSELDEIELFEGAAARSGVEPQNVTIEYSGNIGCGQGLGRMIDVAKEIPGVKFIIRGEGLNKIDLQKRVLGEALSNLSVEGFLPKREYYTRLTHKHVFPLVLLRTGVGLYSIPSKVLAIIKAGKYALYGVDPDSEIARVVNENKIGVVFNPNDINEFKTAVVAVTAIRQDDGMFEELNQSLSRVNVLDKYIGLISRNEVSQR